MPSGRVSDDTKNDPDLETILHIPHPEPDMKYGIRCRLLPEALGTSQPQSRTIQSDAMSSNSESPKALPSIHRFITTRDSSGKSCYSKDLYEPLNFWRVSAGEGNSADFELGFVTEGLPIPLANEMPMPTKRNQDR
ncbi:cupin domain protein [Fusarium sp. NRRL 52700]|nr:cupin domain protein [Fusarium sp. NRRL 52700]